MKVLMIGVDKSTGGGMWTVARNYLENAEFCRKTQLKYIPASITGSIPARLFFTLKAFLHILFALISRNYDIAHIHMAEKGSVFRKGIAIALARLFRCRILLHMHGATFEEWYTSCPHFVKIMIRRIINRADRVVILGEYWRTFVSSLLDEPGKLRVIYNAVKVPDVNPYNPNARNLLFLGVAGKRKGIFDLLDAVSSIGKDLDKDIRLWIYGPDDCEIEEEIRKRDLRHRVEYRGWLAPEQMPETFKNIAVNILPSYNEGLPMTILETMSCGIPNISTSIAAIPEAVDNENGCLIAPGDVSGLSSALLTLLSDQKLRLKKSALAYKTIEDRFALNVHFTRILQLYTEMESLK